MWGQQCPERVAIQQARCVADGALSTLLVQWHVAQMKWCVWETNGHTWWVITLVHEPTGDILNYVRWVIC